MKKKPYKKYQKYRQGIYKPVHKEKYTGSKHPRYLSSWELKFFKWCDINPNVIKWASESVCLPYISPVDKKLHRYFVDNTVHIKEGNNIVKYLIEIKPYKQTQAPKKHGNNKQSTILYAISSYFTFDKILPSLIKLYAETELPEGIAPSYISLFLIIKSCCFLDVK